MADAASGAPVNGTIEIAGPERVPLAELAQRFLNVKQDPREVIPDIHSRYFGTELNDQSLIPDDDARIGPTSFEAWLQSNPQK
jgi:uncharacterized protein YbjT (DUF2867 family)